MAIRWFKLTLTLLALSVAVSSTAGDRAPVIPKGEGEHCVAETDFMRRNHMDLIIHQRDETVIQGIRDEPFSLKECVDCHVQKDASNAPIRIDEEGQFCASCHSFVAVKIDCFGCHAAVPDVAQKETLGDSHWHVNKQFLAFKPAAPTPSKASLNTSSLNTSSLNTSMNNEVEQDRDVDESAKSE